MHEQIKRENMIPENTIMVTDSPAFLGFLYSQEYEDADQFILAYMYEKVLKQTKKYDYIGLLKPRSYKDDGVRIYSPEKTQIFYDRVKNFLIGHNIKFTEINSAYDVVSLVKK